MKILSVFTALSLLGAVPALSQVSTVPGLEVKGPYSSIKKNKDLTTDEFTKTPDAKTITKKTIGPDKVLRATTVYRVNEAGNPLNCDIFDGRGVRLFKSRYGYSKVKDHTYGKLVEEQMFDARIKRTDPNTGEEIPVRRFFYTYNADGSQNKPIAYVLTPGKTFEQAYGTENQADSASGLTFDPFDDGKGKKPANPKAKPAGK